MTEAKKASLTVLGGPLAGTRCVLPDEGPMTIGSAEGSGFRLDTAGVSLFHARVVADASGRFIVHETGAERRLHVNDTAVDSGGTVLRNGDIIWLGTPGEEDVVMLQCILPRRPAESAATIAAAPLRIDLGHSGPGPQASPTPEIETVALWARPPLASPTAEPPAPEPAPEEPADAPAAGPAHDEAPVDLDPHAFDPSAFDPNAFEVKAEVEASSADNDVVEAALPNAVREDEIAGEQTFEAPTEADGLIYAGASPAEDELVEALPAVPAGGELDATPAAPHQAEFVAEPEPHIDTTLAEPEPAAVLPEEATFVAEPEETAFVPEPDDSSTVALPAFVMPPFESAAAVVSEGVAETVVFTSPEGPPSAVPADFEDATVVDEHVAAAAEPVAETLVIGTHAVPALARPAAPTPAAPGPVEAPSFTPTPIPARPPSASHPPGASHPPPRRDGSLRNATAPPRHAGAAHPARPAAPAGRSSSAGLLAAAGFVGVLVLAGVGYFGWKKFAAQAPAATPTPIAALPTATPEAPVATPAPVDAATPEPVATPTPEIAATVAPAGAATPTPRPTATPTPAAATAKPTPTPPAATARATPTPPAGPSADAVRAQQNAAQVQSLLEQADAALAARQFDAAINHADGVLRLDAGNARAAAVRADATRRRDAGRKRFVPGRTAVETQKAAKGGGLTGFDTGDADLRVAPDFQGRLEFEMSPASGLEAGAAWTLKAYVVNEGKKPIRVLGVTIATSVNGAGGGGAVTPKTREIAPQQRALVGETAGSWTDGTTAWQADVTVTANKGDSLRNTLSWR